jgi:Protein of unknown function (DUF3300)
MISSESMISPQQNSVRLSRISRLLRLLACGLILYGSCPDVAFSQQPVAQSAAADTFNAEQLDALLAPIALYPDELLTQILMAATYPLQVVEAARWVEDPAHKSLSGDALVAALEPFPWDPSVKSLVPFPQVLSMMNANLAWMQQLGYAFADQQAAVMDSVQRLRRQAEANNTLQSTPQQVVRTEGQTIIIDPAQPNVVYVPTYNPTVVYGTWPYPAYPPVYLPPPPGYYAGTALVAGLAFGASVAITAGLWGWARPAWGAGQVNVNVNRYNNINVNRQRISSNVWQPNRAGGRPAGLQRPPGGPVGAPARSNGLPANAIGRPSVSVPKNAVNPPGRTTIGQGGNAPGRGNVGQTPSGNRPGVGQGNAGNRPGLGQGNAGNRPNVGQTPSGNRPGLGQGNAGNRPNVGQTPSGNRPSLGQGNAGNRAGGGRQAIGNRPAAGTPPAQQPRAPGAFAGMNQGRQANQFGARGGQSRAIGQAQRPSGAGRPAAGGGRGRRG